MTEELLAELLAAVRDGGVEVEDALERLRGFPVDASVAGARVDTHRKLRTGAAEVVFCPGKTPEQVAGILARLRAHHGRALGTRATPEQARQVRERLPEAEYDPVSRLLTVGWRSPSGAAAAERHRGDAASAISVEAGSFGTGASAARGAAPCGVARPRSDTGGAPREQRSVERPPVVPDGEQRCATPAAPCRPGARATRHAAPGDAAKPASGAGGEAVPSDAAIPGAAADRRDGGRQDSPALVAVVTAGTSDLPVAEEAAQTLEFLGGRVQRCYDVGVAGLHRLLAVRPQLERAAVVICVAGMEGALTSVVGGLLAAPVIGVPTSVGYGAHLGGAAPLLAMLNSCASGVAVVNIDNGFGAALMAHAIVRQIEAAVAPARHSRHPRQAGGAASCA